MTKRPLMGCRAWNSARQAIFQCLQGLPEGGLRRIILTASGGAFRDWPVEKLKEVRAADAIKHPNWRWALKALPTHCARTMPSGRQGTHVSLASEVLSGLPLRRARLLACSCRCRVLTCARGMSSISAHGGLRLHELPCGRGVLQGNY